VLTAAQEESAVMSLATVRQMPSGVEWLPLVEWSRNVVPIKSRRRSSVGDG
jgi:hypothetical protein